MTAPTTHAGYNVAAHLDLLVPLCWEHEFRERFGQPTPTEEWELTVDVLWDMDQFPSTTTTAAVTCDACMELIHA